ncbi:MAG: SRPBCC family protein [Acidimicrobiales bacterium]|nr:SRPBCC family protein [Acidimicrobiales bacterium]
MDVTESLEVASAPAAVFAWVDALDRYPRWLDIVVRAESADAAPGDPGPAWRVDLRGRLGPLSRAKRLRMVRTVHDAPRRAVFERREVDGRSHSPWVLDATVDPAPSGARLTMRLHYGGSLWGPVLERMLRDEVERSRPRLAAAVGGA